MTKKPRTCGTATSWKDVPLHACGRPALILPSGSSSPYCYWHRLIRTSLEAQNREASRRRANAAHSMDSPDQETDKLCVSCLTWCPIWYMEGKRCKACAWHRRRSRRNQTVYGVEPDEWQAVFDLQDGKCAICGNEQLDRSIALDHDHKTGKARGLLCKRCNHDLLGAAFDSLRILRNAVRYLEHPPFSGEWEGRIER